MHNKRATCNNRTGMACETKPECAAINDTWTTKDTESCFFCRKLDETDGDLDPKPKEYPWCRARILFNFSSFTMTSISFCFSSRCFDLTRSMAILVRHWKVPWRALTSFSKACMSSGGTNSLDGQQRTQKTGRIQTHRKKSATVAMCALLNLHSFHQFIKALQVPRCKPGRFPTHQTQRSEGEKEKRTNCTTVTRTPNWEDTDGRTDGQTDRQTHIDR